MFTGLALSLALVAASPAPPPLADRPITRYLEAHVIATDPGHNSTADYATSSDPLKNGAVIGAVIGGIVSGAALGLLCHAFNDTGEPMCWKATLLWGGIGAGAGAGIGAGVDALFTRHGGIRASLRF